MANIPTQRGRYAQSDLSRSFRMILAELQLAKSRALFEPFSSLFRLRAEEPVPL